MNSQTYCAAVGFAEGIESSNVVGYAQGKNTVDQFNFVSIGFNTVGCNTMDIQQIRISDGGLGGIGWTSEVFSIWQGGPDVVEGSDAFYLDPSLDPTQEATDYYWGDAEGNKVSYSIAAGQGVVIQCGPDLEVQTSGQVPEGDVKLTTVDQFNFIGNPFPVTLDIQNIKISDGGLGGIGWTSEVFSIWQGGPDVVEGSDAFYLDPSLDPAQEATDYYWGDAEGNKVNYSIAIGQSCVIQCGPELEITVEQPYSL